MSLYSYEKEMPKVETKKKRGFKWAVKGLAVALTISFAVAVNLAVTNNLMKDAVIELQVSQERLAYQPATLYVTPVQYVELTPKQVKAIKAQPDTLRVDTSDKGQVNIPLWPGKTFAVDEPKKRD